MQPLFHNVKYNELPNSIIFKDGEIYDINPDYRIMVDFSIAITEQEKPIENILFETFQLFYLKKQPSFDIAFEGLYKFYIRNQKNKTTTENLDTARTFAYDYDFGLLASAFSSTYNLNLYDINTKIHWWEFVDKFQSLTDENMLVKIIGYRSTNLNELSKETRKIYAKLKNRYALPKPKGELQNVTDFING